MYRAAWNFYFLFIKSWLFELPGMDHIVRMVFLFVKIVLWENNTCICIRVCTKASWWNTSCIVPYRYTICCLTENVFLLLFVLFFLSSFIESALTSFQVMVKQQFCKSVSERSGRRNLKVGPVLNYFELNFEKKPSESKGIRQIRRQFLSKTTLLYHQNQKVSNDLKMLLALTTYAIQRMTTYVSFIFFT